MIKILVNDGIHPDGRLLLEEASYSLDDQKIPQDELPSKIGEYDVLLVRSATKVTKEVLDAAKKLKIIGRGGVGLDNIDVEYAQSKGIQVFNTPKASSPWLNWPWHTSDSECFNAATASFNRQ
ncbi:MAG: hypothetical protein R2778_17400 [Saprospiraceae bacterium]